MGALTTIFNAYASRIWYSNFSETADILDCMGVNIRVEKNYSDKMSLKIFPLENYELNGLWITNITRYCYDSLFIFRLYMPMIKLFFWGMYYKGGRMIKVSWGFCCAFITKYIFIPEEVKFVKIMGYCGALMSLESIFLFKRLLMTLGCRLLGIAHSDYFCISDFRFFYLLNTTRIGFLKTDCVLLIGFNPELEAPLLGLQLRKCFLKAKTRLLKVYSLGLGITSCFGFQVLNVVNNISGLISLCNGYHFLCQKLVKYSRVTVFIGASVLSRCDNLFLLTNILKFCSRLNAIKGNWVGFNVIYDNSAHVNIFDIGYIMNMKAKVITSKSCSNYSLKNVFNKFFKCGNNIFHYYILNLCGYILYAICKTWYMLLAIIWFSFRCFSFFGQKICNYNLSLNNLIYDWFRSVVDISLELGYLWKRGGFKALPRFEVSSKFFDANKFLELEDYNYIKHKTFNIYQGTHFSINSPFNDILLPTCALGEYNSMFLSIEGRLCFINKFLESMCFLDWNVFNIFFYFLRKLYK